MVSLYEVDWAGPGRLATMAHPPGGEALPAAMASLAGAGVDTLVSALCEDEVANLALAGQPLLAAYRTVRGGHKLNHAVLSALMADPTAWRVVEFAEPARRPRAQAQIPAGLAAAAYGPDVS